MLKPVRLAALDLDGTLVDSAPDLAHCLGQALHSAGFRRPSLEETRNWIGDGVEALVRKGLTAVTGKPPDRERFEATLAAFDACYRENLFRLSRVYPGVPETLMSLKDAGLRVGCITNKRRAFALDLLERAGIRGSLAFVHGGDSFARSKPDPEPLVRTAAQAGFAPDQCVMVGDSVNDRRAAAAAGFRFVFAAYGYAAADDPELGSGLATITSFPELLGLLCAEQGAK